MPTNDELEELLSKCKWVFTKLNKVDGYKITGPNGNSIFLPCAGRYSGTKIIHQGSFGSYWSSSLDPYDDTSAASLNFYWRYDDTGGGNLRFEGCPIRSVF